MKVLVVLFLVFLFEDIYTKSIKRDSLSDLTDDLSEEILNDLEDEIDEDADVELSDNRWRFRPPSKIRLIWRLLKPKCLGCAGICEEPVPGRCACRRRRNCIFG